MKLYGIPNCNTVKKARSWLDENGVAYDFHDYKKQCIDEATLAAWLDQVPKEILINRSGLTWRGLSDEAKTAALQVNIHAPSGAIDLMCSKPSVIKRPILIKNSRIIALGFNETEYTQLLKS
jgi:Spx/MgsR family transcriptional regulator